MGRLHTMLLNFEVRNILRRLETKLPFKLYPKVLNNTFIEKLRYRLLFKLILNHRIKIVKKYYESEFKLIDNKPLFCLTTFPRSGTNYCSSVLHSYFELLYGVGDGIFKYTPTEDSYIDNINPYIKSLDLHNGILFDKKFTFYKKNHNFENKLIHGAGHFPLGDINTVFLQNLNFIVLRRSHLDSISSWYIMKDKNNLLNSGDINYKILNETISQKKYYDKFWKDNEYKLDYINVLYEDLISQPVNEFSKMLSYANIDINNECLAKSIEINSIKSTRNRIVSKDTNRITSDKLIKYKSKIKDYISSNNE